MFECHITVSTEYSEKATEIAKLLHWKTSEIARDPILGNDTYFYLTTHAKEFTEMWSKLRFCVAHLDTLQVPIIREKIELIVHDTKVKLSN